ncbi:hypothetical protein L1274_000719 [Duganella sp. HSC-15S17]|uniref:Uncharacterized protein n=1 Tax=Duganella violaceipulchra TaxID=2849652 RepID=A0ABT1GEP4_9BURK|nr:hypothetical protein [Duganella violaceicalia]
MTDNDEVPNAERSPDAARIALALIVMFIVGMVAGIWAAA